MTVVSRLQESVKLFLSVKVCGYNRRMSFAKRLFALLSVIVCLCLFAQQAEQAYAMEFDAPEFSHVQHLEMDNDRDACEPILALHMPLIKPDFFFDIKVALLADSYRQPDISLLHRPPIA